MWKLCHRGLLRAWPASPSLSLHGPSADQLSLHDVSPVHIDKTSFIFILFVSIIFGVSQEQARVSSYSHSRFCWRGQWALLLPSSSEGSGPRSDTAVQTGPSPAASCVCPAVTVSHKEAIICVSVFVCVSVCVCLCVCVLGDSTHIEVHFITIWDFWWLDVWHKPVERCYIGNILDSFWGVFLVCFYIHIYT